MAEKTLSELISEAQDAIEVYRDPKISEAQDRLHAVLVAAGMSGIDGGIEDLAYSNDVLCITTVDRHGERSRENLPRYIIEDADPIRAATVFGLKHRLGKAQRDVKEAERLFNFHSGKVQEYSSALAKYQAVETAQPKGPNQ